MEQSKFKVKRRNVIQIIKESQKKINTFGKMRFSLNTTKKLNIMTVQIKKTRMHLIRLDLSFNLMSKLKY